MSQLTFYVTGIAIDGVITLLTVKTQWRNVRCVWMRHRYRFRSPSCSVTRSRRTWNIYYGSTGLTWLRAPWTANSGRKSTWYWPASDQWDVVRTSWILPRTSKSKSTIFEYYLVLPKNTPATPSHRCCNGLLKDRESKKIILLYARECAH
jgi:hypothetical protein